MASFWFPPNKGFPTLSNTHRKINVCSCFAPPPSVRPLAWGSARLLARLLAQLELLQLLSGLVRLLSPRVSRVHLDVFTILGMVVKHRVLQPPTQNKQKQKTKKNTCQEQYRCVCCEKKAFCWVQSHLVGLMEKKFQKTISKGEGHTKGQPCFQGELQRTTISCGVLQFQGLYTMGALMRNPQWDNRGPLPSKMNVDKPISFL